MKKFSTSRSLFSAMLAIVACSFFFYASSTGITGQTRKPGSGNGCTCHGTSATAGVTVTINGPSTLNINQTGSYTVTISGGPLAAAGTNIAVSSGTLATVTGGGLQKIGSELTHTGPKTPVGGVVTFSFSFTAPATAGSVTMYANGNSVNNTGNNSGDQWNFAADKVITVGTSRVNDNETVKSFVLSQNYPNPFNPSTKIAFELKEAGNTSLVVYSATGELVSSLINMYLPAGEHSVNFDGSKLKSGVYFYNLNVNGHSAVRKMILNK